MTEFDKEFEKLEGTVTGMVKLMIVVWALTIFGSLALTITCVLCGLRYLGVL